MTGSVSVYDSRRDLDHKMAIEILELRDGQLWIESSMVARTHGTIEDSDVVTIRDPRGAIVSRFWITMLRTMVIKEGDQVTLLLPISLGGPRGIALCDSSLDVAL